MAFPNHSSSEIGLGNTTREKIVLKKRKRTPSRATHERVAASGSTARIAKKILFQKCPKNVHKGLSPPTDWRGTRGPKHTFCGFSSSWSPKTRQVSAVLSKKKPFLAPTRERERERERETERKRTFKKKRSCEKFSLEENGGPGGAFFKKGPPSLSSLSACSSVSRFSVRARLRARCVAHAVSADARRSQRAQSRPPKRALTCALHLEVVSFQTQTYIWTLWSRFAPAGLERGP